MENSDPQPVPYADPKLPTGPTGFRQLGYYPSDGADPFGGRMRDDGTCISLVPSRSINLRSITYLIIWLVWALGAVIYLPRGPTPTSLWRGRVCAGTFVTFALGVFYFCLRPESRDRRPWIIVDRKRQRILLPRSDRSFPFADVLRAQLVSMSSMGAFAEATGTGKKPPTGELQLVFHESGPERPWCVASGLDVTVAKRFAVAFRHITGIPVSRAIYHPVLAEWQVEPFDGDWDDSALMNSSSPTSR